MSDKSPESKAPAAKAPATKAPRQKPPSQKPPVLLHVGVHVHVTFAPGAFDSGAFDGGLLSRGLLSRGLLTRGLLTLSADKAENNVFNSHLDNISDEMNGVRSQTSVSG